MSKDITVTMPISEYEQMKEEINKFKREHIRQFITTELVCGNESYLRDVIVDLDKIERFFLANSRYRSVKVVGNSKEEVTVK